MNELGSALLGYFVGKVLDYASQKGTPILKDRQERLINYWLDKWIDICNTCTGKVGLKEETKVDIDLSFDDLWTAITCLVEALWHSPEHQHVIRGYLRQTIKEGKELLSDTGPKSKEQQDLESSTKLTLDLLSKVEAEQDPGKVVELISAYKHILKSYASEELILKGLNMRMPKSIAVEVTSSKGDNKVEHEVIPWLNSVGFKEVFPGVHMQPAFINGKIVPPDLKLAHAVIQYMDSNTERWIMRRDIKGIKDALSLTLLTSPKSYDWKDISFDILDEQDSSFF